jgi:hypothetical protein
MNGDKQKTDEQTNPGWYKPEDPTMNSAAPGAADAPSGTPGPVEEAVEWTASEFVAHEKGAGWYVILALVALVVAAGSYLLTKDMFSTVVVLLMAAVFGIASARKPRVVSYRLDWSGLTVGRKFYPYAAFKSYVMPEEGPFVSVMLIPLKRFDFPVSAYLAPESQQKALDLLGSHLPMEQGGVDRLEKLMNQLRF